MPQTRMDDEATVQAWRDLDAVPPEDLKLCCAYSCAPAMDPLPGARSKNSFCCGRICILGPAENRLYVVLTVLLATVPSISFVLSTWDRFDEEFREAHNHAKIRQSGERSTVQVVSHLLDLPSTSLEALSILRQLCLEIRPSLSMGWDMHRPT